MLLGKAQYNVDLYLYVSVQLVSWFHLIHLISPEIMLDKDNARVHENNESC